MHPTPRPHLGAIGPKPHEKKGVWGVAPSGCLLDRKTRGPLPKLTAAQKAELARLVEAGSDRQKDGIVRWRRVDLKAVIAERFGVAYHERSVSRLLHELGFAHLSARSYHPAQKATVLEDFKKCMARPRSASDFALMA